LATPLRRCPARAVHRKPFAAFAANHRLLSAQAASGWRRSDRHILPDQPCGQSLGIAADGAVPLPARAKTALPEPVMRLLP